MSLKSQFLKKLQAGRPAPSSFSSRAQADIAEFRLRITQLQQQMDAWLEGTGLNAEMLSTSVTDLLVGREAFEIDGIILCYDERTVKFMPVFLYGQGVTGGVEVTFHHGGNITPLGRLFMRSGTVSGWTFAPHGALSRPVQGLDESTFFGLIFALLP